MTAAEDGSRRAAQRCGTIKHMPPTTVYPVHELAFAEVGTAPGGDFAAFFAIYEEAIPARERKTANALRAMCTSADYRIVVAKMAAEVAGFFVLFVGRSMALLEYMAVREGQRGAGLGAELYRRAREEAGSALPLLVEADSDREPAADGELRARRKRFYRRLGCRVIADLNFVMPLPGEGAPARMDLLVDDMHSDALLPKSVVASWLSEIYRNVYSRGDDDPRLLAMIGSLQENVRLV